jgi:hypothetical protein
MALGLIFASEKGGSFVDNVDNYLALHAIAAIGIDARRPLVT